MICKTNWLREVKPNFETYVEKRETEALRRRKHLAARNAMNSMALLVFGFSLSCGIFCLEHSLQSE